MTINLTFDLELYPPSHLDNALIQRQGTIIEECIDTLKTFQISATFFCTGDYALRFPDILRRLIREENEIGNHTMHHIPFKNSTRGDFILQIKECDKVLQETFQKKIFGFRAPGGNIPFDISNDLSDIGYMYDSSICRTYIPGWYVGGFGEKQPYEVKPEDIRQQGESNFIEIPMGTFLRLPIPLGGVFLSSLPFPTSNEIEKMCNDRRLHIAYFHPIDLIGSPGSNRYVWDIFRRGSRAKDMLETILKKNKGRDMRLVSIAEKLKMERSG